MTTHGADTLPLHEDAGAFAHKALHEHLRSHARATPGKTAIVWYGRRISYAELDDLSDRFARCLQSRGLGGGDVVVLFMRNCPQYLIAHFGVQKIGAIVSPCNPHAKAYEFEHQVGELDASAIVAGGELMEVVTESAVLRRVPHVFSVNYADMLPAVLAIDLPDELGLPGECGWRFADFAVDLLSEIGWSRARVPAHLETRTAPTGTAAVWPLVDMDDVALMASTSGTTGLPKSALLSHASVLYKTAATVRGFVIEASDVMLADVPLHHISGMMTGLAVPIMAGATVVLLQRFDALAVLQAIEACRVSWWYSMAPSFVSVMACDVAAQFDLSSLTMTVGTSFGVQLTESLAERWAAFTGGCRVYEAGYGLSETHTCDAMMPRDAVRWGTNGKPIPGVEIRIGDIATGASLATGERGEILLRSPLPFRGYWRQPQASAAAVRDGWVRTGDIGQLDDDGYLTFVGRINEMIKVWSYSVFPEEVEAILATHPDVRQAAVVGCPDANRGAALHAYVVLSPEAAARHRGRGAHHGAANDALGERLIAWCGTHMSHYKVPRTVVFCDELPASGSGKLLRRQLAEQTQAARDGKAVPRRYHRLIARLFERAERLEAR